MKDAAHSKTTTGWKTVPLADAAIVGAGNSAPQKKELFENGRYPFIRTSDVGQIGFGEIGGARDLLNDAGVAKLKRVPKGAILMPKSGASTFLNHRVETTVDAYVSSHLATIEARPDRALPRYLLYYLSTVKAQDLIQDHKYPSLTLGVIGNIPVPLPSLEEQKRIVAVLDQAFAALDRARAHAEANLAATMELFDSELRHAFAKAGADVEQVPFDGLCTTLTAKTKVPRKDYLPEGAYPIVSQEADLISGYCNDPTSLMGVGEPVVIFGDHTRCLKYVDFDFVVGADGTKVLKPKKGISADYLYYGLRSRPVDETGYARHFKFIREVSLPRLSLEDQHALAYRLSEIEDKCRVLRGAYESKLASLAALRQALLQRAFSGQLT